MITVKRVLGITFFFILALQCVAQKKTFVQGVVVDKEDGSTLPGATISFNGKQDKVLFADASGAFSVELVQGEKYTVTVSYIGYETYKKEWVCTSATPLKVALKSNVLLSEVVVTAKEKRSVVTTSVIGRDAMNLLQPTSIADLMELLPGGYSKDPSMGVANMITMRETGNIGSTGTIYHNNDYSIASLGTQFIVDGAPIITDANLQYSPLSDTQSYVAGSSAEDVRNTTNKGVDMRTIGTDDIEKVEVVRGIPSTEYGNLTSGIVNIKKIRRVMPFTARFKADGYSKLFSIGKGFSLFGNMGNIVNIDLGYLDSKTDPTNNLENYKRLNASVRYTHRRTNDKSNWNWNSSLDYSGSFDNNKADANLNYGRIDEYKANYNRIAFNNSFAMHWADRLLSDVEVNTALSLQLDRLTERRLVAPQRYGIIPTGWEDGENVAGAVFSEYVADYLCDGKPFDAYVKAKANLKFDISKVTNNTKIGINWDYSKNFGDGQVYDMQRPLSTISWSSRPRKYSDIPAIQNLSLFAEDNFSTKIGESSLEGMIGARANTMLGLSSKYSMSGKVYIDPRVNVSWRLPYINMYDKPLRITLAAGWGLTTKNPTLNYLYPDMYYSNFIEMAYYDITNPAQNSQFVVMSYKQDPTNYDIKPARNAKWEGRVDMEWNNNTLSLGYFHENMTSAFRYSRIYDTYTYKKYDDSYMTPGADFHTLPFTTMQVLDGYQQTTNGSRLTKQGIELQFTSARIKPLRTRVNISGAWFHSIYSNSQPMYEPVSLVVNNQSVSEKYVGLYAWSDGRTNDMLNTNFTFDTQIPEWGFVFVTSVQCIWFTRTKTQYKNGYPIAYLSATDGMLHEFTAADESDIYLKQLIKTYSSTQFDPYNIPISMTVNLKATKQIGQHMKLAFFVNKILDYLPDYTSRGQLIRRNVSPYFGVEASVTL